MQWKASAHGYGQPRESVDRAVMCDAVAHMIFGNAGLDHARDLNRPRRRERVQVHAGRSGRREDHRIANSDLNHRRTGGSERALSAPCARARAPAAHARFAGRSATLTPTYRQSLGQLGDQSTGRSAGELALAHTV